jgi:cytochrome P450
MEPVSITVICTRTAERQFTLGVFMSDWNPITAWEPIESATDDRASSVYGPLREACPVAYSDAMYNGFWAVFRHADLVSVALDTATFSNVLPLYTTRRPPLESDPPEHSIFRRLMNPYFSKERIAELETVVRGFAVEMLEKVIEDGEADLASTLTYPLPSRVLCALLGVADSDWQVINEWTAIPLDGLGPTRGSASRDRVSSTDSLRPYIEQLIADRRADPRDDLVTGMVLARVNDEPLPDEFIVGLVMMLITAGHNTTTSAMGNAILALARDSELQAQLRADPRLIPAAIEEWIRLEAPQQSMRRVATRDVELGGRQVKAGERVELVFGSANLDPDAFPEPDRFRLDRTPNRHVGFGRGIHMCIGAPLARLEVGVLLEEILARTASIELSGEVTRAAWPRMGVTRFPVRLTANEKA